MAKIVLTDEDIFSELAARKAHFNNFDLSEKNTIKIIETLDQFRVVQSSLRQDYFSQEKLKADGIFTKLKELQTLKKELVEYSPMQVRSGFIIVDEPDNMAKNDGWGSWHIFSFVYFKVKGIPPSFFIDRYKSLSH
jgi:hypothetical protein